MIINQGNLRALTVGYSTAFNKSLAETVSEYQKIATVIPSSTAENSYKWLGQMPSLREWIGEREIQHLDSYGYTIRNKKFEKTLAVPRDDIEDDQYAIYTPFFSQMGEEAATHPDDLCFGLLAQGFTEKCYDGKAFFASDHPSGDKTFSNVGKKKLDRDSYVEARTAMMSVAGDKGKSLRIVPDLLVVSPKNEMAARHILEADRVDGTSNVLKGTADILVTPQLAGKNEEKWFLLCTKRFLKPLIYQMRKPLKLVQLTKEDDINVFMRDEYLYGVDGRSNAGFGFWQMAYGSDGTAEAVNG